jgi:hypothetical protein
MVQISSHTSWIMYRTHLQANKNLTGMSYQCLTRWDESAKKIFQNRCSSCVIVFRLITPSDVVNSIYTAAIQTQTTYCCAFMFVCCGRLASVTPDYLGPVALEPLSDASGSHTHWIWLVQTPFSLITAQFSFVTDEIERVFIPGAIRRRRSRDDDCVW